MHRFRPTPANFRKLLSAGNAGINGTKTGAAQSLNAQQINDMPTISHSIADVARLNPQLTTTNSGVMSFAGTNNRYNQLLIDGAANNDVFGLSSTGSNGGQAGTQPVSLETIEQIQVNVAPLMSARADSPVVRSMPSLRAEQTSSTAVPMVTVTTRIF